MKGRPHGRKTPVRVLDRDEVSVRERFDFLDRVTALDRQPLATAECFLQVLSRHQPLPPEAQPRARVEQVGFTDVGGHKF